MSRALLVLDKEGVQRRKAQDWIWAAKDGSRVEFKGPKRTLDQNSLMWALLTDVALHMRKSGGLEYSTEDWKHVFLHGWGREVRFLPALDGKGVVPVPKSSADLSKDEMTDFIEFIMKEGAERGITFNKPSDPSPAGSPAGAGDDSSAAESTSTPPAADPATTSEEPKWLRDFAVMIVAAAAVDEEFVVDTSRGAFVEGLSDDTRARAREMTQIAREISRGEKQKDYGEVLIAGKAGIDVDVLRARLKEVA